MRSPILLLLLSLFGCIASAQPSPGDAILGKAGDRFITENEFVRRFELLPGLYRHQSARLDEDKLVVFYSLVAEKLLAQEAIDRGLDSDSLFLASMADMEKLLARDELYREEVIGKVHVSNAEIQQGIRQALRQLFITYIYTDSAGEASFLRSRITKLHGFNQLEIDSSMGAMRDTATVIWGDADPAIESAAYRLHVGETSPVVKARTGYYILHLTNEGPSGFYTSLEPDILRERVAQHLEQQKEELRLNQYMGSILKGKTGYARPVPFKILASALLETYRKNTNDTSIVLSDAMHAEVIARCKSSLGDTLVVAGSTVWSVERVLDRLASNGFALQPAQVAELPARLSHQLEIWVWQELLAQEALKRGMDNRPQVKKDVAEWRESFLAQFMRRRVARSITATDAEVMAYMKRMGDTVRVPVVQIRELKTSTAVEMQKALADLENHVPFEEVIRRWSNDPAAKQRNGLSDFFSVNGRAPLGEIAGQMKIGQFYGPVTVDDGMDYFELVARKDSGSVRDTSIASRFKTAKDDLIALKTKTTLNMLLAQSGQKRGFTVYQDRLQALQVSAVPMVTFRVIGFGGRIFAAPMLEKQVEWLEIPPPSTQVVP